MGEGWMWGGRKRPATATATETATTTMMGLMKWGMMVEMMEEGMGIRREMMQQPY
jgi:hypothetical protein